MSGEVSYMVSVDGKKFEFKNFNEYQAWLKSKQDPRITKLEQELKNLQAEEITAFNNAKDTYTQIYALESQITNLKHRSDSVSQRLVADTQKQLDELSSNPEIHAHREIVAKIHGVEAKLQNLRSR